MQKIFISYSRKDTDFVRKLAGDLEKAGYDVWWDITDLRGGDDWVRQIPAAIESSQFILVVLSPNSVASEWVEKEYTQALSLRKKIIPIMLAPCNVPFALNTINYTNFSVGGYEDNFKSLLSALGFTGEPPAVTPFQNVKLPLPIWMRYAIPAFIGIVILLAFLFKPRTEPSLPTSTPAPTTTATSTLEPFTVTPSATGTPSSTATSTTTPTITPTNKPTLTPSPTQPPFESLGFCVVSVKDFPAINVRSGPATYYTTRGEGLRVGRCLTFSAIITNEREEMWLLVANNQNDPAMQQYEGGWIRRDLLIPEGLTGSINLPIVTLTATPTITLTPTPSFTPTRTPSPTDTPTATSTDTSTPSPEPTETNIPAL
jgi:hypothetical protein